MFGIKLFFLFYAFNSLNAKQREKTENAIKYFRQIQSKEINKTQKISENINCIKKGIEQYAGQSAKIKMTKINQMP